MKTLHYSTVIDAPRTRVWDIMLGPETFRAWTRAFAEGSYFEGSWDEGQSIRFLIPDGSGMVSTIARNEPYAFVSIKHLGIIRDGVVDTESAAARTWTPSCENYSLSDTGAGTALTIDVDTPPEYEAFMEDAWPKALARLKALCETGT